MLSDLAIQSLKPTGKQYVVWDVPNFGVRISQGGTKTFIVLVGRERRKVTIGRYPSISLKDARRKAQLLLLQPASEQSTETLHQVLDAYRDLHLSRYRAINKRDTTFLIYKYLEPLFAKRIATITSKHIMAILDPMTPSMHNHIFGIFRTFFNWAERRNQIESSPLAKLRKTHKEQARSRVLTNDELARVWRATEQLEHFGAIIRICILTGQRRGEVSQTQPEWIDASVRDAPVIIFPGTITKNGREHRLPLTRATLDLFANSPGTFNGWSKSKKRLDDASGTTGWTIHDLRRTFATNYAKLGIQPHVIERILNHATGTISGIAAVYNRHHFQDEMRQALQTHEQWLLHLVSPSDA